MSVTFALNLPLVWGDSKRFMLHPNGFELVADAWAEERQKAAFGGVSDSDVIFAFSYPAKLNPLIRIHLEDQNI